MLSEPETCPHLHLLCERVFGWRQEIGLQRRIDPKKLQEVLDEAASVDVEVDLILFVVALCEWWFRVYRPGEAGIRRALQHRLSTPAYTPQGRPGHAPLQTSQLSSLTNRYVDACLREFWEEDTSDESSNLVRLSLSGKVNELVRAWAVPVLVPELRRLPPKRGGYGRWAPWVAATVLYHALKEVWPSRQDSMSNREARRLAGALLGRSVTASEFHRRRRQVENESPQLVKNLMGGFHNARRAFIQDPIGHLLNQEVLPSLAGSGGLSLLTGEPVPES